MVITHFCKVVTGIKFISEYYRTFANELTDDRF